MKVKSIKPFLYRLNFKQPFKISYETVNSAEIVIIKIESDNGLIGYGAASPDKEVSRVTGERIKGIYGKLQDVPDIFFKREIENIYNYHEILNKFYPNFTSLRAAFEMALFDLLGKFYCLPVFKLIGSYRNKAETMITIGIKDEQETIRDIKKRLKQGFKIIKIKCGLDVEGDVKRIRAASSIVPKGVKIILDANQGYSFIEAEYLLKEVKNFSISFLEQPIKADDIKNLAKLTGLKILPIIADESIINGEDAVNLLVNNIVDGVNIKLMKCGGLIDFIKIFNLAKKYNKITVIGCMYESHLSLTAAAHLALALPIDYVDLDSGHLDFSNDPFIGGMKLNKNNFTIDGKFSGLGVRPKYLNLL